MKRVSIIFLLFIVAGLTIGVNQARAQDDPAPEYQQHMWWAWNNWDAGGSCNCVPSYFALGVPQFVAAGGRAGVMRYAAGAAQVNPEYAFQLVILTQCHNPDAQQVLIAAGQQNVLAYLTWLASTQLVQ